MAKVYRLREAVFMLTQLYICTSGPCGCAELLHVARFILTVLFMLLAHALAMREMSESPAPTQPMPSAAPELQMQPCVCTCSTIHDHPLPKR